MPEESSTDLNKIAEEAKKHIREFAGKGEIKEEEEPIAVVIESKAITDSRCTYVGR